jgi:hypothetical protein
MWQSGDELPQPDCFPNGKDELTVFKTLVLLRIIRDKRINNDQLETLKFLARKYFIEQSAKIDNLDINGYRVDNPDLGKTGNRPDRIDPETTRIIAALLHNLCPGGTRTKDGLFFIPPPLPTSYHKIVQLEDWTSSTIQCAGVQPSNEELVDALIERGSTIGQYVQFAPVPPILISYLYTHEGCEGIVTLQENVVMVCTKEGGYLIIARNTDGKVELQTRHANAKGEFHAPKAIFSSNIKKGGPNGQNLLRVVYFTFSSQMMEWLDKMYTDHMTQNKSDSRHCNGRLVWPRGNSRNKTNQEITECVIDIDDDDEI